MTALSFRMSALSLRSREIYLMNNPRSDVSTALDMTTQYLPEMSALSFRTNALSFRMSALSFRAKSRNLL